MENCCIVITTTNEENAKQIASQLVAQRLAACVQMSNINSVYEWEGEVCFDNEVLMLIKTREAIFENVKAKIEELHSYDLPEIIKIKIDDGNEGYMKWISQMTR